MFAIKEHSWRNDEDGTSGFIDLVIDHGLHSGSAFVIECKRLLDTEWLFLSSSGKSSSDRLATKTYRVDGSVGCWHKATSFPASHMVDFCVSRKLEGKARDAPLENTAFSIRSATESVALEEAQFKSAEQTRDFLSMIVTNAPLMVATFDRTRISNETGSLPEDTQFENVQYVRFEKQLSLSINTPQPEDQVRKDLGMRQTWTQTKENSVFVVNSQHLAEFLNHFELT